MASWQTRLQAAFNQACTDERASQIVEFALSLPLLVLFVVGIFDFSGAITLKQKLTNAVREGARVAAADPANDVGSSALPASVADAFQVVDNYLLSEKIADCGLAGQQPVKTTTGTPLTWKSVASDPPCATSGAFSLEISRACVQKVNNANMVGTCVTIRYPYKWQFNNIGGTFTGPISITTSAVAFNEN